MSSQKRSDSYKRLPCKGLIRDGYCPYKNRCQYIHEEEFKIDISDTESENITDIQSIVDYIQSVVK